MDPRAIWREWTLRQIACMSRLARREQWREKVWQARLAGGDEQQEPDWDLDGSRARFYKAQYEAMTRERRERGG